MFSNKKEKKEERVFPYTIYHLDHEALLKLERESSHSELSNQENEIVKCYVDYTSNKPRVDSKIDEIIEGRYRNTDLERQNIKREIALANNEKVRRKAISALKLMKFGMFIKVAQVDAVTANDAVYMTISTTVNKGWMFSSNKNIKPYDEAWRSTETYDVVMRFDDMFIKMPLGYIDVTEKKYAESTI